MAKGIDQLQRPYIEKCIYVSSHESRPAHSRRGFSFTPFYFSEHRGRSEPRKEGIKAARFLALSRADFFLSVFFLIQVNVRSENELYGRVSCFKNFPIGKFKIENLKINDLVKVELVQPHFFFLSDSLINTTVLLT